MYVDMNNPAVQRHIEWALALPIEHLLSPYSYLPITQTVLIEWARSYEEGEPLVSDIVYDGTVRQLQREKLFFPRVWKEVSLPEFKIDDAWMYTGTFYK